jgi:hypothetical protein
MSVAKGFWMKIRGDNDGTSVNGSTAHSNDELDGSWRQSRSSKR